MSLSIPPLRTLRPAQVAAAVAVLEAVAAGETSDGALGRQLRQMPQAGSRDRRWIGAIVYGVLRRGAAPARELGDAVPAWVAQWLQTQANAGAETLQRLGLEALPPALAGAVEPAALQRWPDWLLRAARQHLDDASIERLAADLARPPQVDLRVNRLRAGVEAARAALAEDGVGAVPLPQVPGALRLEGRQPLQATRAWREGWIEPQDAGSQQLCRMLAARPGEVVADWCAGAGGKTLALAAAMAGEGPPGAVSAAPGGRLLALDVDPRRLQRLAPRARRLGVSGIDSRVLADAPEAAADGDADLAAACDAVLVDAPCSGVGTLRRHPELLLRDCDLEAMAERQGRILRRAAGAVRPGGRLLYATCSFLPQENEAVVAAFVDTHRDFRIERTAAEAVEGLSLDADGWLRIDPDRLDSDAFRAVLLRRQSG